MCVCVSKEICFQELAHEIIRLINLKSVEQTSRLETREEPML